MGAGEFALLSPICDIVQSINIWRSQRESFIFLGCCRKSLHLNARPSMAGFSPRQLKGSALQHRRGKAFLPPPSWLLKGHVRKFEGAEKKRRLRPQLCVCSESRDLDSSPLDNVYRELGFRALWTREKIPQRAFSHITTERENKGGSHANRGERKRKERKKERRRQQKFLANCQGEAFSARERTEKCTFLE